MTAITHISSPSQFASIIQSNALVVADFYADWCGPCKDIAPLYERLSQHCEANSPQKVVFTKINTDEQKQIATAYSISAMPTFLIFRNGREVNRVTGADQKKLLEAVRSLDANINSVSTATEGSSASSGGSGETSWRGTDLPKGFIDITDQVDVKDLDILNLDNEFGDARVLFSTAPPSALNVNSKGKEKVGEGERDWIESDTDEQLMIFVPFNSTLKIHTLHITSLPPTSSEGNEAPMRPKKIHLFSNRAHNLGFEEAENIQPSQAIELSAKDWNEKSGTAKLELRFVRFQNITSLVIFVVNGDGEGEKVRLDRIRIVGETGEKRGMGKLEKVGGDDS